MAYSSQASAERFLSKEEASMNWQKNLIGIGLLWAGLIGTVQAEDDWKISKREEKQLLENKPELTPKKNSPTDEETAKRLEISFGNSQLFSAGRKQALSGELSGYIPTRAALFLLEGLVGKRWSMVAALNIPFSGEVEIEDGELISRMPSPIFCLGSRWSPWQYTLNTRAVIEGQVATLIGRSIGNPKGDIFFPTVGTRMHISRPNGFGMYMGVLFSFRRESLALIYGVGNRF